MTRFAGVLAVVLLLSSSAVAQFDEEPVADGDASISADASASFGGSADMDATASAPDMSMPSEGSDRAAESDASKEKLALTVGASVGWGFDSGTPLSFNPHGLTVRPRLGATMADFIYFGGLVNYSFGGEGDVNFIDPVTLMDVPGGTLSASMLFIGAEIGVDIKPSERIVLRPTFASGASIFNAEACNPVGGCTSTAKTYAALQFGMQAMIRFGALYVGLDVAHLIVSRRRMFNPPDQPFVGVSIGAMPDFDI